MPVELTLDELLEPAARTVAEVGADRIAHVSEQPIEQLAALLGALHQNRDALLATREVAGIDAHGFVRLPHDIVPAWHNQVLTVSGSFFSDGRFAQRTTDVYVLTSGTTGEPRLIRHSWQSIATFADRDAAPATWLCTYAPGTYAWLQVVVGTLHLSAQRIVFPAALDVAAIGDALLTQGVTAISSTPSLWRLLFAYFDRAALGAVPLRQITLGGERADQPLLDELTSLYPHARVVHVYASTETGAVFAVADGRAGFPRSYLERPINRGRAELRIADGTLHVRSRFQHADAGDWVDTGDEVEIVGDRVLFRGRRGHSTINVGGSKVLAATVEDCVMQLPGIAWARARAVRAPLMGELVGLDVVLKPGAWSSAEAAEIAIGDACARVLPPSHVPRHLRILEDIPMGSNWKSETVKP